MQAVGHFPQPRQRGRADLAFRCRHRTQEGGIVIRIGQQPQPGQHILDLGPLQKRSTAGQVIRHALQLQRLFQRARLVVATEQDRKIVPLCVVLVGQEGDLGRDTFRLALGIGTFEHPDRLALGVVAPEFFRVQMRVVGDQRVGRAQDTACAAVILFQLDNAQFRVILPEAFDIGGVGAAPGVDRLVVIAHAGERAARPGQQFQQRILRGVGVLVFVHQQIAQALAPGIAQGFVLLQQLHRQPDQVIEIDRVERRQTLLVLAVDIGRLAFARALRQLGGALGREAVGLGARDQIADRGNVRATASARHQILDQRTCIIAVEDRKTAPQPGGIVFDLQELQPERMEGADRQTLSIDPAQQRIRALAHLACRLVGKGDRGDLLRRHLAAHDQVLDLLRDHAGLARTCAGQYQQRRIAMFHSGALGGIQTHVAQTLRQPGNPALCLPGAGLSCMRPRWGLPDQRTGRAERSDARRATGVESGEAHLAAARKW